MAERQFTPFKDMWQVLAGDLGITTKRMRENAAIEQALMDQMAVNSQRQLELAMANAATETDRAQFQDLERQRQQYVAMTKSRDDEIRRAGLKGLSTLATGNLLEDIESRAEVIADAQFAEEVQVRGAMRQTLIAQAEDLRKQAAGLYETQRLRQEQFDQANRLLNDPDFDPNNALNQGALGELLNLSKREILANAEDMADALGAAGGVPIIGSVIAVLAGAAKAEDMKFSKEDWRRIFNAAEEATQKSFLNQQQFFEGQALQLGRAGRQVGLNVKYEDGQVLYDLYNTAQTEMGPGIPESFISGQEGSYPEVEAPIVPEGIGNISLRQPDDGNPIPLGQAIETFFNPELRKRPNETNAQYRQRLADLRAREDAPFVGPPAPGPLQRLRDRLAARRAERERRAREARERLFGGTNAQ